MVFRGMVPGVYYLWKTCNEHVSGFKNNCHGGFKSRRATYGAHSKAVLKEACNVEVCNADRHFGLKNFIIIVQFIVIVVLFCWCDRV